MMGYKRYDSCYAKASPDEPIFVLRAQDRLAPETLQFWIDIAERDGVCPSKLNDARLSLRDMREWQELHETKIPD